jgi:hypothetical protein
MNAKLSRILSTLSLLAFAAAGQAAGLNSELLANGDAETGTTTGWVSNGIEALSTATTVGVPPGTAGLPPGITTGAFVFNGGTGTAAGQTLGQTVALSGLYDLIDAGGVMASFSILLQSRRAGSAVDSEQGELRFWGDGNSLLASQTFVDDHVVSNVWDWSTFSDVHSLPIGTRSIEVALVFARTGTGVSTDAYADNASLVLTSAVPEPNAAWLLLAGLPLLCLRRRAAQTAS